MNRFLILVSLLLTAISCSNLDEEQPIVPIKGTVVSLNAPLTDSGTRVSANTDNDNSWTFAWDDGDAIAAWHSSSCTTPEKFTMTEYNGDNSKFTGTAMDSNTHRFIYPHEGVSTTSVYYHYPVDVSSQDGKLNKTYLINDALINTTDIVEGVVSTLNMKHVGGFMVVTVRLSGCASTSTYTLTGVEYSDIPVQAELDMSQSFSDSGLYASKTEGSVSVTELAETFVTDADYSSYLKAITRLNILPFDLEAGQSVTVALTIDIESSAGVTTTKTTSVTLTNTGLESLPFARATHNNTNLTVAVDALYGVEVVGATINDDWVEVDSGELVTTNGVYEIYNAADLKAFASLVNNSGRTYISAKLMNDIDLEGSEDNQWTPMGKSTCKYAGTFDGDGYQVQNLYINSAYSQQALFGFVSIDGVVCNLGVTGEVTAYSDGTNYETAGIVAFNYGTVVNCYNEANISGEINVGGVVGHNDGCVLNCYNRGTVTGTGDSSTEGKNIGGVCGQCDDESDSENLVGYGYILACCNTGAVSGNFNVGVMLGWLNALDRGLLSACYSIGDDATDNIIGWMKATTDANGDALAAGSLAGATYPSFILTEDEMTGNTTVVGALNVKAAQCNLDPNLKVKACAWKVETDGYPELDFGVAP